MNSAKVISRLAFVAGSRNTLGEFLLGNKLVCQNFKTLNHVRAHKLASRKYQRIKNDFHRLS